MRPVHSGSGASNDWENPAVLGINKRASHAPLRSFRDLQSAVAVFRPAVVGTNPTSLLVSDDIARHRAAVPRSLDSVGISGNLSSSSPAFRSGIRKLSGCDWAFKLFRNPGEVPLDFPNPAHSASGWAPVGGYGVKKRAPSADAWIILICFSPPSLVAPCLFQP